MNYFITKVNNKISKITYFNENDNHKEYSIQFIYTKNKTTSLKIKNKQIYLRVGTYATQKDLEKFCNIHIEKFVAILQKQEQIEEMIDLNNHFFYLFGQKYKYKIIVLNDKTFLGIYRDKEIIEYKILIKKLEKEYITDKINIFLAGQLKNKLQIFHDTYQKIMKVPEHKINIRKKKNSWATNHVNKKNIYYNFKLVHHDLEKIKYVVAHELAHYFEANHSKKFWEIVEKYEINWKKIRKRLNKGE